MSEEAKPTNDPCAVCGRPVDSHTPVEASNCRNNRQPSVIPKPKVEAKVEAKPETTTTRSETTTTSTEDPTAEVNT